MITGRLNLFSEQDLDSIHNAAMSVLQKVGVKVYHDRLLESLARYGAQVDFAAKTARVPEKMVEDIVADQKKRPFRPDREAGEAKGDYQVHLSGVIAPFYYDYDRKQRRKATKADLIELLHFGDVLGGRVGLPVTMGDVDGRVECIEALALQVEHTRNPAGAYVHRACQVPYVMRIADIYGRDKIGRSFGGPSFITSPITIGMHLGDLIFERARWGIKDFSIGVMPISGGNGTLDGGRIYSPVELMLEKELGDGMWKFAKGVPVTDETLALDAIREVGAGEGKPYADSDHTLRHFRQALWHPRFMDRSSYESDEAEVAKERRLLDGANEAFHETLRRYEPPNVDRKMLGEIRKVVEDARRDLLR